MLSLKADNNNMEKLTSYVLTGYAHCDGLIRLSEDICLIGQPWSDVATLIR